MSPKNSWALALLVVVVIGVCSCTSPANESPSSQPAGTESSPVSPAITISVVDDAIVQVWDSEILAATGVVIGDGSQVLTVLNFEESIPNSLDVVIESGDRYHASIQAIDPRTGVTLLKVDASGLPVAGTGDATSLVPNQQVIATWYQQPYTGGSPREPELKKTELLTLPDSGGAPVSFGVYFPPGSMPDIPHVGQGAVITDEKGVVLCLLGPDYNALFPHPHAPGGLPWVASINVALELLSPDFAARPYANGPLMIVIVNELAGAYRSGYFPNYDAVTGVIQKTLRQLGSPLPVDDLPQDRHAVTDNPVDGNTVTVVYARPVELTSADGTLRAQAKWVSIQWDRANGKPNLLFYGSGHLNLEGGFQLPDDLSDLLTAIDPLAYHQSSP